MAPVTGSGGNLPPSLEDASLVFFEAHPAHLNPFESSFLRWKVTAPAGVTIEVGGTSVWKDSGELVKPPYTTSYGLVARVGNASKTLGTVDVTVDLSQCQMFRQPFLDALIRAGILSRPDKLPSGVYFREDPKVTVTPGQIQIHLSLGKKVDRWIPDVDIDIDMSFGLTLAPDTRARASGLSPTSATRLASTNESYSASVTEQWYVNLIGGIPLALALAMYVDSATARAPGIIQSVVDGLDAEYRPFGSEGLQKHTVAIGVDEKNMPFIEANWCPPPARLQEIPMIQNPKTTTARKLRQR